MVSILKDVYPSHKKIGGGGGGAVCLIIVSHQVLSLSIRSIKKVQICYHSHWKSLMVVVVACLIIVSLKVLNLELDNIKPLLLSVSKILDNGDKMEVPVWYEENIHKHIFLIFPVHRSPSWQ